MRCGYCAHPAHDGVCGHPLTEDVMSNGDGGVPASQIPYRTEIVGTCPCGTPLRAPDFVIPPGQRIPIATGHPGITLWTAQPEDDQ